MTEPLLTIGMAHHTDFSGAYFTIQSLRLYFPHLMDRIEIIVVDNSPTHTKHAEKLKGLISKCQHNTAGARYVEMATPLGTSPSRDRIFQEAKGKYVLAMDCHVLLIPGALDFLFEYYRQNPETKDIISGPLVYDPLHPLTKSTHFDDVWEAQMWGRWGSAWKCPCGPDGLIFSINQNREGRTVARELRLGLHLQESCPACGKEIPRMPWARHEENFANAGYIHMANQDAPFEIPGQGLGLFSCRKDAWLGFHSKSRQFGGEELYIHEKFRRAGGKAICIPQLGWVHRFGPMPEGIQYPHERWGIVRNYVLEFQELEMDLQPIYDHFVKGGFIGEDAWQRLVQHASAYENENEVPTITASAVVESASTVETLEEIYNRVRAIPRDLNEHMETFKNLASRSGTVVEISTRRESTIGFLMGQPKSLISYNTEVEGDVNKCLTLLKEQVTYQHHNFQPSVLIKDIPECDTLFIDTIHRYKQLKEELSTYSPKVSHWIVIHDTSIYGGTSDDGSSPGMIKAIEEFLKANPQWFIMINTNVQYGLIVLSRDEVDQFIGVGTELKLLLSSLGINPAPGCSCNAMAAEMDQWGIEKCKQERESIITRMKMNQDAWGWGAFFRAGLKAVLNGLAFEVLRGKISVSDPIPGLLDVAIERTEAKQKRKDELIAERQNRDVSIAPPDTRKKKWRK